MEGEIHRKWYLRRAFPFCYLSNACFLGGMGRACYLPEGLSVQGARIVGVVVVEVSKKQGGGFSICETGKFAASGNGYIHEVGCA